MSKLQLSVDTQRDAASMKAIIETSLLQRNDVSMLLPTYHWHGNVLHAKGPLGEGTITVSDQLVEIDIDLSPMGTVAQSMITDKLQRILGSM